MDKSTFMKELEQSLSVLQEDELRDILSEYEQHVDMKVKSGLTEEEAIADFGNLSELAAEILEAYHVRADYAENDPGNGNTAVTEKTEQARAARKNMGEKLAAGVKGAGGWIWGACLFLARLAGIPFRWGANVLKRRTKRRTGRKEIPEDEILEDMVPEGEPSGEGSRHVKLLTDRSAVKSRSRVGILLKKITGLVLGVLRLVTSIAVWAIRMAWNACCVGFALFCGLFGLFCLFGFGMLTVLLLQRYPLAGLTVGCFGVMICMFSAAWLGLTLLWRKKAGTAGGADRENGPTAESVELQKGKEEQYA